MRYPTSPEDLSKLIAAEIVTDWTYGVSAGRPVSRLLEAMKLTAEAHPGRHDEPEHEELTEAMFGAYDWIRHDKRAVAGEKITARRHYRTVLGL